MRHRRIFKDTILVQLLSEFKWEVPPLALRNGIVTSYTVSYQAVGGSYKNSTKRHRQVAGASTQADLTGLQENVLYNLTVSASNSAGEGPSSFTIAVRTAEAGKISDCNVARFLCAFTSNCKTEE